MSDAKFRAAREQFDQALQDCPRLYLSSAQLCIEQYPGSLPGTPEEFVQLMDDLHKGLLIKIYVEVVRADGRWSQGEKEAGDGPVQPHLARRGVAGSFARCSHSCVS